MALGQMNNQWDFVGFVIQVYEPVIQQKPRVTLYSIRIINLVPSLDIAHRFNNKALVLVWVLPVCIFWYLVVKHISISNITFGFNSVDGYTENTTTNHHPNLWILFQGKLSKLRHFHTNQIVVVGYFFYSFCDLCLHRTTLQPLPLLDCVKNWEVRETLWHHVYYLFEVRTGFASFFHYKTRKKRMLRCQKPIL